jgi:addiction module RelE/StbE family toxin
VYTIITPKQFLRQAHKFFKKHPDLQSRFVKIVDDLCRNPFQPHLELHPLSGKLKGCHAVNLTGSFRITLTIVITDKEIILLDIGSHDEVYR